MEKKQALIYIVWSNLYLPSLVLYLLLQEKYLGFVDLSITIPLYYLITAAEILNAVHFKLAFGMMQNPNKNLLQFLLAKLSSVKVSELVQAIVCVVSSILVFSFLAIILGASVVSNHEQTFIFATLMSILAILPACIHFNTESVVVLLTTGEYTNSLNESHQYYVVQRFYCTVIGAWLGAFVIPLDWGREWQTWPIPCCVGALVGSGAGQLVSLVQCAKMIRQYRTRSGLLGKTNRRSR